MGGTSGDPGQGGAPEAGGVVGSGGTESGGGSSTNGGSSSTDGGTPGAGGTTSGGATATSGTGSIPRCAEGTVYCFGDCHIPADCVTLSTGGGGSGGEGAGGASNPSGGFTGTSEYCGTGEEYDGKATWYILGDALPNCSFPPTEVPEYYAAMNTEQYATAATCGACVEASANGKSVVVQVVDQCPTCEPGTHHIDLSQPAFSQLDDLSAGIIAITWRYVSCPDTLVTGDLEYAIKDGSSVYWSAIAFRNYPVPITAVEITNRLNQVSVPERQMYNYWLSENGFGLGPYTVSVTDANGQVISFTMPSLPDASETGDPVFTSAGVQFGGC